MKTVLCSVCHKRRVRQHDWMTEDEKKTCLTCHSFITFTDNVLAALTEVGKMKGLCVDGKISVTSLNNTKKKHVKSK